MAYVIRVRLLNKSDHVLTMYKVIGIQVLNVMIKWTTVDDLSKSAMLASFSNATTAPLCGKAVAIASVMLAAPHMKTLCLSWQDRPSGLQMRVHT